MSFKSLKILLLPSQKYIWQTIRLHYFYHWQPKSTSESKSPLILTTKSWDYLGSKTSMF